MFSTEHLATLRAAELAELEGTLVPGQRILELGGGTGQQAMLLRQHGFDIVSVDVADSIYRDERVFPVIEYDGHNLPFADHSFDVVLSSNVLEHVQDLDGLHREIARVLRPGGMSVHAMPTHAWRFWTSMTHYIDLLERLARLMPAMRPVSLSFSGLLPPVRGVINAAGMLLHSVLPDRHGERGNVFSEFYYFHPAWWRREFRKHGFVVVDDRPMAIFYTGYMVLGSRLGLVRRRRLSRVLGSACHLFRVMPR